MHVLWSCLHNVQKNKINACVSSGLVIVTLIVSYGTHDWTRYQSNSVILWRKPPLHIEKQYRETPTSFLCYTNDVNFFRTNRRSSKIFKAKVTEADFVFLTVDGDIKSLLKLKHLPNQKPCFTINDTFLYHCCGYSPHLHESVKNMQERKFVYERHVVTDNYIRIEDIINGKPEMVDLLIKFSLETSDQTTTDVVSRHRCRGDVHIDHYPEIHIYVNTQNANGNLTKNAFHWYL